MLFRQVVLTALTAVSVSLSSASAQPTSATHPARTVIYHPRDLVTLHTKLHYSTLVVLPDGDDVVEATCGDKEFWIVNVRGSLVSVKPAKAGSETNLNVVTAGGQLYAFLLTEISAAKSDEPDLTVYLEPESSTAAGAVPRTGPQYVPAYQLEDYKAQAALAREDARRATESAKRLLDDGMTEFRNTYPLTLSFPYAYVFNKAPFFIQAIFHDDRRTFIQTRARELPSLYELKDGRASLVNYTVRDGTYIVPRILESGYLVLGKQHVTFQPAGRHGDR